MAHHQFFDYGPCLCLVSYDIFAESLPMIRWMVLIFIFLVLLNSATGMLRKVGLGRLPGDFTFRVLGREIFVPCASAVLVTLMLFGGIKLVAWLNMAR